ncbi:Sec1-like protein [Athelia psychrophila]|uniref:Sec1-like protein n=1 Tax=Athelia psychrophila TaxID=1759441 RepID=A0A166NSD1_9AGAM|nr:Sec1-like protein [Fibularhizoctonia sp. CBS 109695]
MTTSTSDPTQASSSAPEDEPALDVNLLKELGKKALIDALNSVNGAKTLVLDASLAGPLGLVTEVALLKHHGVDKMFWLEPGPLTSTTTNVVYLCRPLIRYIKIVADQIKRHAKEGQKHTYTLLLVPRTSTLASRILEEEGVLGDVTVSSYNLQFIPVAEDVISLENDNAFKEIWMDGDETVIYNSAQALATLQKLYGMFPRIIGKGDYAAKLAKLLTHPLSQESSSTTPDAPLEISDKIDSLIILDRQVDMITPLLTQLTYEGLIDELIGIKNSHVELPISLVAPPAPPSGPAAPGTSPPVSTAPVSTLNKEKKKKHHLTTSTDPLFAELRDLNFSSVGKKLNRVAHRLDEDYKARFHAKTVPQLRDFVGKLGGLQTEHQALRLHTGVSEMLALLTHSQLFGKSLEIQQNLLASYEVTAQITAIEEMVAQGADMQTVVRLLCLASITAGGVKSKALENLKREILQAYGYNLLPLLLTLSSPPLSTLLPIPLPATGPASVKYPFSALRKSLRLLIDDTADALDELENDVSYTYSGYAPISARLVQCVAQKGGVLSNPAERERNEREDAKGKGRERDASSLGVGKVQAHPIMGWKGFEDVMAILPGETFDIPQQSGKADLGVSAIASIREPLDKTTTTVVFFLGGCTYTEIAALRWISRQNRGRKFLIATTGIVSGASIIESMAGGRRASSGPKDAGL